MDQILALLIISGLISYSAWTFFTIKANKIGTQIASGAMFSIVLLILWRVFQLNLDFGLVLSIATLFAGLSWIAGLIFNRLLIQHEEDNHAHQEENHVVEPKLKNLILESRSYFWILLVILCIRSFAYEPYQIPSSSMEPGLQVGDFVLVNKFAYGLKLPAVNKLITKVKEPQRGDVAVFIPPHTLCEATSEDARPELSSLSIKEITKFQSSFDSARRQTGCTKFGIKYIKRVIGIPGDRVEIKGYEIYINGKKLEQVLSERKREERLYLEAIGEVNHLIRILGIKEFENSVWIVPPDRYLAIGDNRDNSLDSRAWGYFSKEHLIGRGEFIWLHWGSFTELPHFQRNKRIQ